MQLSQLPQRYSAKARFRLVQAKSSGVSARYDRVNGDSRFADSRSWAGSPPPGMSSALLLVTLRTNTLVVVKANQSYISRQLDAYSSPRSRYARMQLRKYHARSWPGVSLMTSQ